MAFKKDFRVIAAASTATLYTVPIGSEASAPTLTLTATGAATATVTVFDQASGVPVDVITDLALAANVPWALPKPLMLNSLDEVRVSVNGASVGSVFGAFEDSPAGQAVMFNMRGEYDALAEYNTGDLTSRLGSSYVALGDGLIGDAPPSVNWMFSAEKGEQGNQGDQGIQGFEGWSPILSIVSDGERRVQQVNDWTGGTGTKPTTGSYVGPVGLVALVADAADIRGDTGLTGATGPMDPAVYDPQTVGGDAFARANHTGTQAISTVVSLQTSLDEKAGLAGATFTGAIAEKRTTIASSAGVLTINCALGNMFSVTLSENITSVVFSNVPASPAAYGFILEVIQDAGATGYTITWGGSVAWPDLTAPTLTATASARDWFTFATDDGGTLWDAGPAGLNRGVPA